MIITYFGIILFTFVEWVKFIKTRSPVTQARSLQVTGREVAYTCLRQRHEISLSSVFAKRHLNHIENNTFYRRKPLDIDDVEIAGAENKNQYILC